MSRVRTNLIRLGSVALASGVMAGGVAGLVGAATPTATGASGSGSAPTTLAGIKAKAATDITDRVNALNAAIAKVNAAKGLGSSQGALASHLGADIAPLQQLNQTIQADSTAQQAAQDFATIFSDYRVYALVLPATRIAGAADDATTTAIPHFSAVAAKAQARVTSTNQAVLQPLIDDLNNQIGSATSATNGLAATVLAFAPVQWNENNGLLDTAKSSAQTAAAALKKARTDVQQLKQDANSGGRASGAPAAPTTTAG
jgi:hypothetical protein